MGMIKKVNKEVFVSGDKVFLTERECLNYEKGLMNGKNSESIKVFLLKEGFTLTPKKTYLKKGDFNKMYEFKISPHFISLKTYSDSMEYKKQNKEYMSFNLCNVEQFEVFFNHLVKMNEDE